MQEDKTGRIGDYEILGTLGAGGMGRVYRVRHVISDRVEAMKVLLPDLSGRKDLADRFLREIKMVASLNHPNIASLCTALTVDNQLIMVMEFIDGVPLSELLGKGPLPVADALHHLDQALAALDYAHGKGIIHRDIKPANMMLTSGGVLKLMDFGIARASTERALTQTGTTLGSIDYMSPEQIRGQPVDPRSDIYSVGVSLYEMVTGQRPFRGDSDFELMAAHVNQAPRAALEIQPWLPPQLNAAIMRAIAKNPDERFPSAAAMRYELQTIPQGNATSRSATMVEVRTGTIVESRSGTIVEGRPATMVRNAEAAGRGMTQVAGFGTYPAPSTALAKRSSFTVRHRGLLLGCGSALALCAVAVPVYRATRPADPEPPEVIHHPIFTSTPVLTTTPKPVKDPSQAALAPAHLPRQAPSVTPPAPASVSAKAAVVAPTPQPPLEPARPSPEVQAKLDNIETQIDGLDSRATAVNGSLNNMRSTMQKDGMNLRGDIVARQASMNTNLAKARQAFREKDADRAERFATLAESDVTALEAFLGR